MDYDNNIKQKPIFFDESQRRLSLMTWIAALMTTAIIVGAIAFIVSIARTPVAKALHIEREYSHSHANTQLAKKNRGLLAAGKRTVRDAANKADIFAMRHNAGILDAKLKLRAAINSEKQGMPIPASAISPGNVKGPVRAVFFLNNEDKGGVDTLENHIQKTTHLMPVWIRLSKNGDDIEDLRQNGVHGGGPTSFSYDEIVTSLAQKNGVAILPVLQNIDSNGDFDYTMVHNMVSDPEIRTIIIAKLKDYITKGKYQGINIDLETDNAEDRDDLTSFMAELASVLHPLGLLVTQDIQMDSDAYDLKPLGRINDFLVPMLYDQHSGTDEPGPIAAQSWFMDELQKFRKSVPDNKIVLGIGNYGYDWPNDGSEGKPVTFETACQTAEDEQSVDSKDGIIKIDPVSLNPYYVYTDDPDANDPEHKVWLEDATTAYNQMKTASKYHPLGAALWRVGSEDPTIWKFFDRSGDAALNNFSPQSLAEVSYNSPSTTFEGEGDVLNIIKLPQNGKRTITLDPKNKLITQETYIKYPSQYVIRRRGLVNQDTGLNDQNKKIVLTFDDGPDPRWTPQILDILKKYHVPAAFFVVGRNAEANPGILLREWNEGMEIGNHSFTHPEMDQVSLMRTKMELDATQRVIEAITGHKTMIFRSPNRADSEPTTRADLQPILDAHNLGYLFIGNKIDPHDWTPGIKADQIVNKVMTDANEGNCILLHDAGGNTREETIKALPRIIEGLKARGYTFVTVADLIGKSRAEVYPAVGGLAVQFDKAVFLVAYIVGLILTYTFTIAIVLGILRIALMGILAAMQSRRERMRVFDDTYQPPVSVVIAAYNEAKVINKTIATILQSEYPDIEIIVVDDGSKDDTAEMVLSKYRGHERVAVMKKENGGKASALNMGIQESHGEIIVALDADTVFAKDTIGKMVRHFVDPQVGAVSGNVKVGNRSNHWTIWQAVEYITSQNFDRRAFDLLNCITVVPGAVGAWRKEAIIKAGLYSSVTLAEDTDLTFKVRKLGYRIHTDNEALAYTEAPDTLKNLAKQRFRWAFGTLQCLWKHRDAFMRPRYGTFGMIALPSLWIFQIFFQAIAPIVDIGIIWTWFYGQFIIPAANHSDLMMLLGYWAVFTMVEMGGALLAFSLDKEDKGLIGWLPLQRFAYRQLMYYVIIKSLHYALIGKHVGWGKFERKGTVKEPVEAATVTAATSTLDEKEPVGL